MRNAALVALARRVRPTTVPGVIARMETIEGELDDRSGVAVFTRLYRWTTEQVGEGLSAQRFEAAESMADLDLAFAGLYFDAVDAWALGEQVPGAWRPLFERSDDRSVPPLAFAMAGMHAHINRDLAVALVRGAAGPLREDSPEFRDYQLINAVLSQTSDQIRGRILPPGLVAADEALGEADDDLVMRAIVVARRTAWEVAQRLQPLAPVPAAFDAAVAALDASVGATARALLDSGGVLGRST